MQFPINSQNKLYYSIYVEHFSKKNKKSNSESN